MRVFVAIGVFLAASCSSGGGSKTAGGATFDENAAIDRESASNSDTASVSTPDAKGGNDSPSSAAERSGDSDGDGSANAAGTGNAGRAAARGPDAGAGDLAAAAGAGASAAGATDQCSASATQTPAEETISITVGGMTRTFIQHLPPGYPGGTPMPVVIDFHGRGGSASRQKDSTSWGMVADQMGFIMIWPDGIGNTWNAGRCCGSTADDVAFVRAMIETLKEQVCIDPKRVYATGCSAGGAMTYKVACDAADVIAAVAPVDFDCAYSPDNSGNAPSCGGCSPARPIAEIQFRGTADSMAVFEGGIRPGGTNNHAGAAKNFAEWGEINKCTGTPEPLPNQASCRGYPECAGAADTILCTVQDGAHCASYESFGIVQLAWELFQKHSLP